MPKPTRTEATCDVCGSPVWIVSSGEGTHHYESRAAELKKTVAWYKRALLSACEYITDPDCDLPKNPEWFLRLTREEAADAQAGSDAAPAE